MAARAVHEAAGDRARAARLDRVVQWHRDPVSENDFYAELLAGLRGHLSRVPAGRWEWAWHVSRPGGDVLASGFAPDVGAARLGVATAAVGATRRGDAAGR